MQVTAHLTLRPVRPEDEPFLRELRAHVDIERLHLNQWSVEALPLAQQVIASQFHVHAAHYRKVKNLRDTKDCVIELNGVTVGRFIVTQNAEEVYLSDIAVHPNFRGQGIGEAVVESTKHECEQSRRLLHLHVDKDNTALQFYLRLGFRAIGQSEINFLMEWVPASLIGRTQVHAPKTSG
ncbi:MAG: GNAT family N-acetyltransferase [Candidatus Didemnitutus sp.]|nr:GNAT family N-acetyltransferase [Candidatus Didemnitutus sp.]